MSDLAPVELFGIVWDPEETPDGYRFAVAHLAAHAIDPKPEEVEAA